MDSKLYLERAENEIKLAGIIFKISKDSSMQENIFDIKYPETYYSSVITHSYYAIFYSAKAYLLQKNIQVQAPEEHRKTYEEFKKIVESGELDVELLRIYQKALIRAETLLSIFFEEKRKRGEFTYKTLPQANEMPAEESINNSKIFLKHINSLLSAHNQK